MSLASNASFREAQEVGFFGYPDDIDDYQSGLPHPEWCGADSERLMALGYVFDQCDREPAHPGFHQFRAL